MFPFNKTHWPIGLDIGDREMRVVSLGLKNFARKKGEIVIVGAEEIKLPEGIFDVGDFKNEAEAARLLKTLLQKLGKKLSSREVVASLPEQKTFVTTIEVQANELTEDKIKALAAKQIPIPPEQMIVDWRILDSSYKNYPASKKSVRILIGAAPRQTIEQMTRMLEEAGLVPLALEPESIADIRAVLDESELEDGPMAIIDIGTSRSFLTLVDRGAIELSANLPISAQKITQAIQEALKISYEDAEKQKDACGFDTSRCEGAPREVLQTIIDDLANKINQAIHFLYTTTHVKKRPKFIRLCGKGGQIIKMDSVLSQRLKIKVRAGNPLNKIIAANSATVIKKEPAAWATAIGLALRPAHIDLIEEAGINPKGKL